MIISIGTKNKAKLAACQEILTQAFTGATLYTYEVDSGVSAMPMTQDETAQGAINRATTALAAHKGADLGVGLEGGVYDGPYGHLYLLGWVAILDKQGTLGLGHSGGVMLPDDIATALREGGELGPIIQERMQDTNNTIRHGLGATGLLTNGLYPRNREFEDALRNAVAPFVSPQFYTKDAQVTLE
jgi:inosine/xanthosine triphosphatase